MIRILYISLVAAFFTNCGNLEKDKISEKTKPELSNKYIYSLCDSIISNQGNLDKVWNFNEVDTGTIEFHDINLFESVDGERVVTIKGITGCSSGCSGHLVMIFEPQMNSLIHVSQEPNDLTFVDYNKDGKSELLIHNLIMWMGECREYHSLFDIENEIVYFSIGGNSPEICGLTEKDPYVKDTLLNTFDLKFKDIDSDEIDEIILTTKIRTVQDTNLRTVIDTVKIKNQPQHGINKI